MAQSRLEEIYIKQRNERLGINLDKLEYDRVQNPAQLIQDLKQSDDQLRERALDRYEKVFGCRKLTCEGLLGARLEAREESLAERIIEADRQRGAGMKLSLARVEFQGKKLLLGIEHTRF